MSLSNNFPTIAPSLNLDFANVKALDPRITFTRTTTATYYDGVTTAKAEQNLLLYSQEFDNGTGWAAQRATVSANSTTAPDGTSTADSLIEDNTASDTHRIIDNISGNVAVTGSTEYVFSVFAKANTRDWIALSPSNPGVNNYLTYFDLTNGVVGTSAGGNTGSIESVGNGWYRCIVKRTTASNQTQIDAQIYLATGDGTSSYTGDNTSGLYLWGAQLEQRSAVSAYTPTTTQPITNYIPVLQTAASGVARFDHNPTTGESLGLLVEEQRTNLQVYSSEFDNAVWTKSGSSIDANTIVAPDGTLTGDKLVENTANSAHGVVDITSGANPSTSITFSVFVKAAGRNNALVRVMNSAANSNYVYANFDLSAGTVPNSGNVNNATGASATITPVGNGWYRCSVSGVPDTSGTDTEVQILAKNNSNNSACYQGDGFSGIYIWGAQLEAEAFPTSYIATTSASVTRNADAASMTGANFSSWYRADEGTLYAESRCPNGITGNINRIVSLNDGTSSNRIELDTGSAAATVGRNVVNSTSQGAPLAGSFTDFQLRKSALAIQVDNFTLAANTSTDSDTSALVPVVNRLMIGQSTAINSSYLNGTMAKLAFYPARLTDAQLQALTS